MEDLIMKFVDTGNATAIIVGGILYLIIFFKERIQQQNVMIPLQVCRNR